MIGVAVGTIEGGQSLNFAIPAGLLSDLLRNRSAFSHLKLSEFSSSIGRFAKARLRDSKSVAAYKRSDLALENLVGDVRSIEEIIYAPEVELGTFKLGDPAVIIYTEYGEDGNIDFQAEKRFATYVRINGLNDFTPGLRPSYDPNPSIFERYFDYEGLSKTVEIRYQSKWGDGQTFTGRKVDKYADYFVEQETRYDANGKLTQKNVWKREPGGRAVEIEYSDDGTESRRIETVSISETQDDNVSKVRCLGEYCYAEDSSDQYIRNTADETEIRIVFLNPIRKSPAKVVTKFIEKKRRLLIRAMIEGPAYDRPILIQNFRYEYEFDSKGNWTKRTAYEQVVKLGERKWEPFNILKRLIVYRSKS